MAMHLFRYCTKITFLLFIGFQLTACGTTDNPATGISCLSPSGETLNCEFDVPVDPDPDTTAGTGGSTGDNNTGGHGTDPGTGTDPGSGTPPPSASASLTIRWVAPAARADGSGLSLSEIAGYRIYLGSSRNNLSSTVVINDSTAVQRTISNLNAGATYYFVMTTVDSGGRESSYSPVYTVNL